MKKFLITFIVIISMASIFITGCVEDTYDDSEEKTANEGLLKLKITDKLDGIEIIHANVIISMVQVHKANASDDGDEEESDEEENNEDENFTADANGEYEGEVSELIQFIGLANNGEEPYNWSWDFGDGNTSYEQNPQHSYQSAGEYEVNLTATDNKSSIAWDKTIAKIGIDGEDEASLAGWYTIVENPQTYDLIALTNVSEVLGEKNLSEGKYTQIRLTIEEAEITINNSGEIEVHDLKIPSGNVKLVKAFWIYEDKTTVLTLDFDINESVHKTGKNNYIMKPTIKVLQE